MEVKNFVKIYDGVLPMKVIGNLIKFAKNCDFKKTKIGQGKIDFDIRRTYSSVLTNLSNSLTVAHWFNLLQFVFETGLTKYKLDLKTIHMSFTKIIDIEILKYENKGFYKWHVDHFTHVPRTLSCILLLNNDYEGGNLCFSNPDESEEWSVETKPGRLIIWPSNFLYPHTVKPVTRGVRYSVVGWAL